MKLDFNKIDKLISKKSLTKDSLSNEEVNFMRNIYNMIVDSEDYDNTVNMLSAVYNMGESDIKYIKNIYFLYFASKEEKDVYLYRKRQINNKRSRGFANISIIISLFILMLTFGIYLGYILYNLL